MGVQAQCGSAHKRVTLFGDRFDVGYLFGKGFEPSGFSIDVLVTCLWRDEVVYWD